MRRIAWKPEKNEWLKKVRGLSFEEIEEAITQGKLKAVLVNRKQTNQIVLAVMLGDYIVAIPATVQPTLIMLRTAYYSRKLNLRFGGNQDEEEI